MIELTNVSKQYGNTIAVSDLSFQIGEGQVVGFLGPNGAGKSTTMRMITGYIASDAGEILINGIDVSENPRDVKSLIGYLPENNPLYEDMIVRDYLRFTNSLRGDRADAEALAKTVGETGIETVFYRPIGELSKGYRQRVGLAQAILHEPQILILDEPTEGLDPNQRSEIRSLIKEIGRTRTVVLSTHVLQEVKSTCDRAIIIDHGKLVADGDISGLLERSKGGRRVIVELQGDDPTDPVRGLHGVASVDTAETAAGRRRLTISADGSTELRPLIFELAKEKSWTIWELFQEEVSLEDVFRALTVGEGTDD